MRFRNRYNSNSPKPRREYSVGWLEDALDDLTSKIIRRREPLCFTCGASKDLQCGHLFERRHRMTRWDIDPAGNNHTQCGCCNFNHEEHPERYQDCYVRKFGESAYRELSERAHSRLKFIYGDLLELYESHKSTWQQLRKAA